MATAANAGRLRVRVGKEPLFFRNLSSCQPSTPAAGSSHTPPQSTPVAPPQGIGHSTPKVRSEQHPHKHHTGQPRLLQLNGGQGTHKQMKWRGRTHLRMEHKRKCIIFTVCSKRTNSKPVNLVAGDSPLAASLHEHVKSRQGIAQKCSLALCIASSPSAFMMYLYKLLATPHSQSLLLPRPCKK